MNGRTAPCNQETPNVGDELVTQFTGCTFTGCTHDELFEGVLDARNVDCYYIEEYLETVLSLSQG